MAEMPTVVLSRAFGGRVAFANVIGVAHSLIRKWETRASALRARGHVPSRYNATIVAAAKKRGLNMKEVQTALDKHSCPTCGQSLPRGLQVDMGRVF